MIELLFPRIEASRFLSDHWHAGRWAIEKNTHIHEKIGKYVGLLTDMEVVLSSIEIETRAWSATGSQVCDNQAATQYLRQGHALYLAHVERYFQFLCPLLRKLESDLSVPPGSAHCSLFVSPEGAAIPQHFDHDYGFNVLLTGRKRWRLGLNHWVESPIVGYQWGRNLPPELATFGLPPDSDCLLKSSSELLQAGACVFLPRGVWHATQAEDYCVSLDFAVDPPCRLDHSLSRLREALVSHSELRRSVDSSWPEWVASRDDELKRLVCDAIDAGVLFAGRYAVVQTQGIAEL